MDGKAPKRVAASSADDAHIQEKKLKVDGGKGQSSNSKSADGTLSYNGSGTLEYTLEYSSDEGGGEKFIKNGSAPLTGEHLLSDSNSQHTVILSSDDNDALDSRSHSLNGEDVNNTTISFEGDPRKLWKDTSLIPDADTIANIIPHANDSLIFSTLAKHRANPDRLNIVTANLLDNGAGDGGNIPAVAPTETHSPKGNRNISTTEGDASSSTGQKASGAKGNGFHGDTKQQATAATSNDLFNQAMVLAAEFPREDPSSIYELLEKTDDQAGRLELVRDKLRAIHSPGAAPAASASTAAVTQAPKASLAKDDSISNDPLVRDDPVFRDMRIVSKMFPEKDQNEVYAMVEAHYYKPDRVQVVIDELLRGEKNSQEMPDAANASLELSDTGIKFSKFCFYFILTTNVLVFLSFFLLC
jgi:hypothetical protein